MTNALSATQLAQICDDLLSAQAFNDYCPNGLQVDANRPISTLVTGVTASQALIEAAIDVGADAILVHHGYFWKGEPAPLVGMKGKRIRTLLQNHLSLLAYHLPLDAHPTLGNNALLAQALDLTITGALYPHEKYPIGNISTSTPIRATDFAQKISQTLKRPPLHIISQSPDRLLQKIGLCTGGAQDMIEQAAKMGCDAFISGEISERTTHIAQELGIDYFAAGHHATETYGVRALGEYLATHHQLNVQFIHIDNPV